MRNYEIILIIHPKKDYKTNSILDNYKKLIEEKKGIIKNVEHWENKNLAYPIKKVTKARYVIINLKINKDLKNTLNDKFNFDTCIIRSIIIKKKLNNKNKK
ncbi:MAG: 30S ribosomal protein S6 [Enterobacteriaceae bacterium]